ncbi:hypothetical protein ACM6L3_19385 [Paenibacillus larvae]
MEPSFLHNYTDSTLSSFFISNLIFSSGESSVFALFLPRQGRRIVCVVDLTTPNWLARNILKSNANIEGLTCSCSRPKPLFFRSGFVLPYYLQELALRQSWV